MMRCFGPGSVRYSRDRSRRAGPMQSGRFIQVSAFTFFGTISETHGPETPAIGSTICSSARRLPSVWSRRIWTARCAIGRRRAIMRRPDRGRERPRRTNLSRETTSTALPPTSAARTRRAMSLGWAWRIRNRLNCRRRLCYDGPRDRLVIFNSMEDCHSPMVQEVTSRLRTAQTICTLVKFYKVNVVAGMSISP
jgi:hypothetical protein